MFSVVVSWVVDVGCEVWTPVTQTPYRVSVLRVSFLVCLEHLMERCSSWPTKSWREATINTRKCHQKLSWWVLRPRTWWVASHRAAQAPQLEENDYWHSYLESLTWFWMKILFFFLVSGQQRFSFMGLPSCVFIIFFPDDCSEKRFVLETCAVRQGNWEFLQRFLETLTVAVATQ